MKGQWKGDRSPKGFETGESEVFRDLKLKKSQFYLFVLIFISIFAPKLYLLGRDYGDSL